jgi:hypothetical protein
MIKRFKQLPRGLRRILIVVNVLLPFLGFFEELLFFYAIPIFWAIILTIIWIYDGFKEDEILPE